MQTAENILNIALAPGNLKAKKQQKNQVTA